MKKSLISSLTLATFMASTTAFGAIDWTPYVKDMKHNCNDDSIQKVVIAKTLPKALQPSLAKRQGKMQEGNGKITLTLKNATAFGEPLTKIEVESVWYGEASSTTLHFANGNFVKLLPQFVVNDGQTTVSAGKQQVWLSYAIYDANDHSDNPKPAIQKRLDTNLQSFNYYKSLSDNEKLSFAQNYAKGINKELGYDLEFFEAPRTYLDLLASSTLKSIFDPKHQNDNARHELMGYIVDETGFQTEPYADAGVAKMLKFDKKAKTIMCDSAFVS